MTYMRLNENQQEIYDEIVDHLVPIMDKYEDADSLIVLQEIVAIVKGVVEED